MLSVFYYVVLTPLVRADWTTKVIGGTGGLPEDLVCSPDSWIEYIEGGISSYHDCVTQFKAECTNGDTFESVCGSWGAVEVFNISNAYGFDSVGGATTPWGYVTDLSFFYDGDLLGSFANSQSTKLLNCPENEVIMGLSVRCGSIVDAIQLYCGSPEGYPTEIPTSIPSNVPTSNPNENPTKTPTRMPTTTPTEIPTVDPTVMPTSTPTEKPTITPTNVPTWMPTNLPTLDPTASCPENIQKLETVIDYLMDYVFCMKHSPHPDRCSGTYNEFNLTM